MVKALEKNKTKKDKGKKSKKKGETNDSLSTKDDNTSRKKKDDSQHSKSKTSTMKKIANSLNPSGPPPEPPARPTPKEQNSEEETERHPALPSLPNVPVMSDLMKELGKMSGTPKKPPDKGNVSSNKQQKEDLPPRFTSDNLHKRPPAPLPPEYQQQQGPEQPTRALSPPQHKNGTMLVPAPQAPRKTSHPQAPVKPLVPPPRQALHKSLSSPPPHPPTQNKQNTNPPLQEEKPKEQDAQLSNKAKPTKPAGKPSAARTKSSDNLDFQDGKPKSPVPRPRNRPPPPPPPASLKETGKSTSNSSLSSGDPNLSESSTDGLASPKPRPVPRPRQRGEQQSDQEQGTTNEPTNSRQPPVKSRPAHPPPSIPEIAKKPATRNAASSNQQQVNTPGMKPTSPGPRPTPTKPKPPLKPNIPRKPKITPPSSEPDPHLPPKVNEILQLSYQGQMKVKEILSLTDARVMNDSHNNLLQVIDELKRISLEVLETSSSLTDSLGPQARFKVRRTVTDLESKYSDMESVVETVGPNPNAVDMERIGKAVNSFSGALDSVCTTVRATAS